MSVDNLPKRKTDLKYWEHLLSSKLRIALDWDDFIFGGFVRDFVVNKKIPKDIDVSVQIKDGETIEQAAQRAFRSLESQFGIGNILENHSGVYFCKRKTKATEGELSYSSPKPSPPPKPEKEIWHKVVSVRDRPGADWVEIDLVLTTNNDPYENIDVDLNCFKLNFGLTFIESQYQYVYFKNYEDGFDSRLFLSAARDLDFPTLLQKCKDGKFSVLDEEVSHKRLDVLKQRGYVNDERQARFVNSLDTQNNSLIESQPKETEKMTKAVAVNSFVEMSKSDAKKAGVRVAAKQLQDTTKRAVVALLRDKKMIKKNQENMFLTMLESEMGTALVAALLGYGLTYIPMIKNDPRAAVLAEEFRVTGMATVGNEIAGMFMQSVLPQAMDIIGTLPKLGEVDDDEEEDEVVQVANSRSKTV